MAGRQVRGPEADRLLTLEHAGSENPVLAGDDTVEATNSRHPCPVLRLPPAWPLGCAADDVPAFCLVCFHKEEEELEEVPLQRSVLGWAVGWRDHRAALRPELRGLVTMFMSAQAYHPLHLPAELSGCHRSLPTPPTLP